LHKQANYQLDRVCGSHIQKSIISVSSELASFLKDKFPGSRIHVIKNGYRSTHGHSDLQSRITTSDRPFNIGFAGRLVPVKRVETIIQTAKQLLDSYPDLDFHFYIYGDGPLRTKLEELSASMTTNDVVTFMGHSDTLDEELSKLDVMLLTSEHEGLPMILLEAMSAGIPVIAPAVGGIPDLLENGKYGRLVYSNEHNEYADAIYYLYINPVERTKLANSARTHVINNYSVAATANAYYEIYKKYCPGI
jgi:glycosyltransferase involved in cell wall biosynthesis